MPLDFVVVYHNSQLGSQNWIILGSKMRFSNYLWNYVISHVDAKIISSSKLHAHK